MLETNTMRHVGSFVALLTAGTFLVATSESDGAEATINECRSDFETDELTLSPERPTAVISITDFDEPTMLTVNLYGSGDGSGTLQMFGCEATDEAGFDTGVDRSDEDGSFYIEECAAQGRATIFIDQWDKAASSTFNGIGFTTHDGEINAVDGENYTIGYDHFFAVWDGDEPLDVYATGTFVQRLADPTLIEEDPCSENGPIAEISLISP